MFVREARSTFAWTVVWRKTEKDIIEGFKVKRGSSNDYDRFVLVVELIVRHKFTCSIFLQEERRASICVGGFE